jgi:ribosomal protein S18 acetylase RimI-like enzyme
VLVLTSRTARRADVAAVARLWTTANTGRQAEVGLPLGPVAGAGMAEAEQQVHLRLADPAAFALLVEEDDDLVAMALVLHALAQDGASREPLPGLAHVSMVAVRPDRWGRRLGGLVLDLAQLEARKRGFTHAQLWTHETNRRAQRLYERLGWAASGKTKSDDHGELIRHYIREL